MTITNESEDKKLKLVEVNEENWIDFAGLGLDKQALNRLITDKAKLWLDAGHIFGERSAQLQRIVLACPRATLTQALVRLENAIKEEKL